jgi:hypothetical protein
MEEKKEKKITLKERKYKINDYQNGKTFVYITKMENSSVVTEAIGSLLKHSDFSITQII